MSAPTICFNDFIGLAVLIVLARHQLCGLDGRAFDKPSVGVPTITGD